MFVFVVSLVLCTGPAVVAVIVMLCFSSYIIPFISIIFHNIHETDLITVLAYRC